MVLPFVPVTASDPRAGQAQEEVDLADDLGAAPIGVGERLAQPGVGGRDSGARWTGW